MGMQLHNAIKSRMQQILNLADGVEYVISESSVDVRPEQGEGFNKKPELTSVSFTLRKVIKAD